MEAAEFRYDLFSPAEPLPPPLVALLDTGQELPPEVHAFCLDTLSLPGMRRSFLINAACFLLFAGIGALLILWLLRNPPRNADKESIFLALLVLASGISLVRTVKWSFLWLASRRAFWSTNGVRRFGYFLSGDGLLVRRKRNECYYFPRSVLSGLRIQNRNPVRAYGPPYVEVRLKSGACLWFKEASTGDLDPFKAFLASSPL